MCNLVALVSVVGGHIQCCVCHTYTGTSHFPGQYEGKYACLITFHACKQTV
jgi:hypothetical protein